MLSVSIQIPEGATESIEQDYELLKTMFGDEIYEIKNDETLLQFLLLQKYEISIQNSTADLVEKLKLEDLLLNQNLMYFPYWIKFLYDKNAKVLNTEFYIYWIRRDKQTIATLTSLPTNIEEPYLYNSVEYTKTTVETTLDKEKLIDLLKEIKEIIVIYQNISVNNLLFQLTGANKGIEDFHYKNKKIQLPETHKESTSHHEEKNDTTKEPKEEHKDTEEEYEKFFKSGGVVGETLTDRASTFQGHAIKVFSREEVMKYKKYLLSQKKIKKATHNISAFRFLDKNTQTIIEDYDDDGEDGAGIRLLGVIQKMKKNNVYVMVSRWFGGILLHQDRFKHICDVGKKVIQEHPDIFKE